MQRRFLRSDKRAGIGAALGLADPGSLVELADVGLTLPGAPAVAGARGRVDLDATGTVHQPHRTLGLREVDAAADRGRDLGPDLGKRSRRGRLAD